MRMAAAEMVSEIETINLHFVAFVRTRFHFQKKERREGEEGG
jgi:hypothetical protein